MKHAAGSKRYAFGLSYFNPLGLTSLILIDNFHLGWIRAVEKKLLFNGFTYTASRIFGGSQKNNETTDLGDCPPS